MYPAQLRPWDCTKHTLSLQVNDFGVPCWMCLICGISYGAGSRGPYTSWRNSMTLFGHTFVGPG